jgi:hypothetical protein
MSEHRRSLDIGFWLPLALLTAYPISFGPAYWLWWHVKLPTWTAEAITEFYHPLNHLARAAGFRSALKSYAQLGTDPNQQPATPKLEHPPGPNFRFMRHGMEIMGAVIVVWTIWRGIRRFNRRDGSPPDTP